MKQIKFRKPYYVCLDCGYCVRHKELNTDTNQIFQASHHFQPEDGRFAFPDYNGDNDCDDIQKTQAWFICSNCGCIEHLEYGQDGLCENCR